MKLFPALPEHLRTLQAWFPDARSLRQWGGPQFRYPFTDVTFKEDMRWQSIPAYSLLDDENGLIGFGQYYGKHGRCHLARLVIDPARRGAGMGRYFIRSLMQTGMAELDADECSLYVMESNRRAIRCYTSLGFVRAPCPDSDPVYENIGFMVFKRSGDGIPF